MDKENADNIGTAAITGLRWRALYVHSRAEKKVAENLAAKGYKAYVPLVRTMRQWSDRKKFVELPLLSGYVFVRIADQDCDKMLFNRGVVSFVKSQGRIALVREEEIARLQQLVTLGYQVESYAIQLRPLNTGEKVRFTAGPFNGLEGFVSDDALHSTIEVVLESIGQCLRVLAPKEVLVSVDNRYA